jgi:hypothetical protein
MCLHRRQGTFGAWGNDCLWMDEKISKRRLTFVKKRGIMQSGKDKRCFYFYKNKGGNHDED